MEDLTKNATMHFDVSSITNKIAKSKAESTVDKRKRGVKNRHGKEVMVDTSNFNPNETVEEYPGPGKNSQEDRIVSRELHLNEFKNIPVGPTVIQLG